MRMVLCHKLPLVPIIFMTMKAQSTMIIMLTMTRLNFAHGMKDVDPLILEVMDHSSMEVCCGT